jgi:hypothetical protein
MLLLDAWGSNSGVDEVQDLRRAVGHGSARSNPTSCCEHVFAVAQ